MSTSLNLRAAMVFGVLTITVFLDTSLEVDSS